MKGQLNDVTDVDTWFKSRQPPPFERGKYEVFGRARNCSVCGKPFTRFIRLDDKRLWCRYCLFKILDESDPDVY